MLAAERRGLPYKFDTAHSVNKCNGSGMSIKGIVIEKDDLDLPSRIIFKGHSVYCFENVQRSFLILDTNNIVPYSI